MTANSWIKDKKIFSGLKKKRVNWHQNLKNNAEKFTKDKDSKFKKSLQFILLLRKFDNLIDFKNIKLLKAFLTKYGKIRPRRKTRVSPKQQRAISKSIKKARALGLIPFTCDVKI